MFSQQNSRSKLDYTSRFVNLHESIILQFLVSLNVAFQNESRVRNHRILSISLPEHSRIEIETITFSDREHGGNEMDVLTFHEREHTRINHDMHKDFRILAIS